MELGIELTGTTPLVMHNPRLADPLDAMSKEIAKISKKTRKTEDDHAELSRLEWLGGLYTDNGKIVMPTANLRKCLVQTARAFKQGKQVERSVYFREQLTPILYQGPNDLQALYNTGLFTDRASVVVSGKRIIRVRPKFSPWRIETDVIINESLINPEDFERILTLAGQVEGLCDARNIGFGRFEAEIVM